jgi:hypothetical protein
MKDLNVKNAKTIKFFEENIEINLHVLGLGNEFLRYITKAQATKRNK